MSPIENAAGDTESASRLTGLVQRRESYRVWLGFLPASPPGSNGGGSGERNNWGDWGEAVMLELAYKHPRTGKRTDIRQAVRIARHEPFELMTRKRAAGVLGCDAEWNAEASAVHRLGLYPPKKVAPNSLRSDLRWASGKTLQTLRSTENAQSRYAESDDGPNGVPNGVLAEPVIKRIVRGLFPKQRLTYFEIESTDDGNFVLRTLTPEAQEWSAKFLAEPRPNGDRIVSSAIVAAVAAEAIKRGYLVQFV